jgi:hypothetical protein
MLDNDELSKALLWTTGQPGVDLKELDTAVTILRAKARQWDEYQKASVEKKGNGAAKRA